MNVPGKSRRIFLQAMPCVLAASAPVAATATTEPNVLVPLPDYSPQIGTLLSEMTWMRSKVARTVKGLTTEQLDFLLDDKANRIGALLLHLGATERIYQLLTFENVPVGKVEDHPQFKEWKTAMDLGEPARRTIKGN